MIHFSRIHWNNRIVEKTNSAKTPVQQFPKSDTMATRFVPDCHQAGGKRLGGLGGVRWQGDVGEGEQSTQALMRPKEQVLQGIRVPLKPSNAAHRCTAASQTALR